MPKGVPYKKKKPDWKKTTYKKGSKKSLAFKDANKVVRPEKKWIDVINTLTTPIGSAFVTTPLHINPTSNATGAGSARLGAKISMKSLVIKANNIWPGNQAQTAPSQVRHVIIYDKQSNGVAPSRSDVFADGTLWNSPLNLFNQDRFIVLADVLSEQIASNGQFCVGTEIFRKMDLEAVWPSAGTGYPNTGSISYWVAANSNWNNSTTAYFPTVEIYSRIRYTDC